jgi:hypothetical protein
VPGKLGLWGSARRCEAGRLDRQAQGAEYAVREGGVDHEGDDGAATTARTVENVLGEHASFTLHLVQGICPLALRLEIVLDMGESVVAASIAIHQARCRCALRPGPACAIDGSSSA